MSEQSSEEIIALNYILRSLEGEDLERLAPSCEALTLAQGKVLFDMDDAIGHLYFPGTAMISVVTSTESGKLAEAGVIGREGVAGVEALMGDRTAINRYIVQLPGSAIRIKMKAVKKEFEHCGLFQESTLAFTREMMVQMGQTVLCNRMHIAEQRLAKWLLMCQDRAATDKLPITQEFAALMLGSNRTSVTQAARELQNAALIEYRRGNITILDRDGLETFSCECYERIRSEHKRLIG